MASLITVYISNTYYYNARLQYTVLFTLLILCYTVIYSAIYTIIIMLHCNLQYYPYYYYNAVL